jgi:hypothetical protein
MALAARDSMVYFFLADRRSIDNRLNSAILPVGRTALVEIEYEFGKLPSPTIFHGLDMLFQLYP